ncbi:MAG: hypothetical protein O7G84_13600 [Gammaproteobacteria bacterium]|nr:hypothetical protein [Gammaproteobacteria bacterium]
MPKATKQQLRDEIVRLRHVGWQMSNVMFNLEQRLRPGKPATVTGKEALLCKQLQREWDAIERSERTTP